MESLTRKQFDILTYLAENPEQENTQRKLAEEINMSLGSVNKTLSSLMELGYVEHGKITSQGLDSLEPYRVKRAIFIAAGFGSRLVPVTLNTPKPLVRVKGVRMIDTLLDAVVAAGIQEIVIVRGYLSEQFDQLLYKYPNIKFVENPAYNETNNISSAMCVRYLLRQAYVLEADLVLYNPKLITKYQYCSNYLGVPTEVTDDWCFETKKGYISRLRIGGKIFRSGVCPSGRKATFLCFHAAVKGRFRHQADLDVVQPYGSLACRRDLEKHSRRLRVG